jgi:hypothetical protein
MKSKLAAIGIYLILGSFSVFSQNDSSGVYFKASDYTKDHLSFATNCPSRKLKINAEMLFQPAEISIKYNGSVHKYPKDSIYAVKYCDGSIDRIYNKTEYPLVNRGEAILIYKLSSTVESKEGSRLIVRFYFSKDAKSNIMDLTISNLKEAFSDNYKFQKLIDREFKSNEDLASYDDLYKITELNRVWKNALETR